MGAVLLQIPPFPPVTLGCQFVLFPFGSFAGAHSHNLPLEISFLSFLDLRHFPVYSQSICASYLEHSQVFL